VKADQKKDITLVAVKGGGCRLSLKKAAGIERPLKNFIWSKFEHKKRARDGLF